MFTHDMRTEWLRKFVKGELYARRIRPGATPSPGELVLPDGFATVVEAPASPLLDQAVETFHQWCERAMNLSGGDRRPGVTWRLAEELLPDPVNPLAHETDAFCIEVTADGVLLTARHARGLHHATHRLAWLMIDRGGPFLAPGRYEHQPCFQPRITNGIFIHGDQTVADLEGFDDEYLALMGRYGFNGIHHHLRLVDLWCSETLPELNAADFQAQADRLPQTCRRFARFGLDVYLYLANLPLPANHPVFLADPRRRGAMIDPTVWGGPYHHALCIGSPDVLAGYRETIAAIFGAIPELAGAIVIVGGEGLVHCYTRPAKPHAGYTSCPHCRDVAPSQPIARLVNTVAEAVKSTGSHRAVFAWPYSAFTWSAPDMAQTEWIRHLSPEVSFQANFDCNCPDPTTGSGAYLYDYNIKLTEPSPVYAKQAATVRELGRPYYTKIECTTTPDAFFLPYLPLHNRWHARFLAMRRLGVSGCMTQWRFYGMIGAPSEELFYRTAWEGERPTTELLHAVACRDFGLEPSAADSVVEAWCSLGDAWEDFPYSALTAGEREDYMRGPF